MDPVAPLNPLNEHEKAMRDVLLEQAARMLGGRPPKAAALAEEARTLKHEVADGIDRGRMTIATAGHGVRAVQSMIGQMHALIDAAGQDPDARANYAKQYDTLVQQTRQLADDAGVRGYNLLMGTRNADKGRPDRQVVGFNGGPAEQTTNLPVDGIFFGANTEFVDVNNPSDRFTLSEDGQHLKGPKNAPDPVEESTNFVGNLTDVKLRIRNRQDRGDEFGQNDTIGDINGNDRVDVGEGFEIDFVLDNSEGTATSTGIAFSNAELVSESGEHYRFVFNDRGRLPDAQVGETVTTNRGSDLDFNVLNNLRQGEGFRIVIDFEADGESVQGAEFGPAVIGEVKAGDLLPHINGEPKQVVDTTTPPKSNRTLYDTDKLRVKPIDESGLLFEVTFADGRTRTLRRSDGGMGLNHSFLYNGFRSEADRSAAHQSLEHVETQLMDGFRRLGLSDSILNIREDFNVRRASILDTGSDKLSDVDLGESLAIQRTAAARLGVLTLLKQQRAAAQQGVGGLLQSAV